LKGRCIICDTVGRLTRDHVPPRSVAPPKELELRRLAMAVEPGNKPDQFRVGFQAPTFPSLCRVCNTDRLGGQYDPTLAKLAADVRTWVAATTDLGIWVPGDIRVETQPFRLARSVVGHLLAAEERKDPARRPPRGTLTDALRAFFLDDAAPWPEDHHVYMWLYPARKQVIVRGFGISRVLGSRYDPIVGDVLKFFPVAFWITLDPATGVQHRLAEVPLQTAGTIDTSVTLTIPLRGLPPPTWPEQPGEGEIVLINDERTSVATMRRT
jgi:hypothetical protein